MDFISNNEQQIKEMLTEIGINSVEHLFEYIPSELILPKPNSDDGLSEFEGMQLMESIGNQNRFPNYVNYLGAGAYEHHIPSLVGFICGKSEFLTSYTPYQAEASQGGLQSIFEFQSVVCSLTGLDVANASVYDGASACAEAILMAMRLNPDKNKILVSSTLNPNYQEVVKQYLASHEVNIEMVPFNAKGQIEIENLIDDQTAALLVQYPSFLGTIDQLENIFSKAKEKGAISIICANPLVYGLFASAKELGADIAVGDVQPFGIPLQFGGPYAGYMSCRQEFVRQLPGRIVGETTDIEGKRGFVLTLQAREQHIRREKATSNICTNQALAALASLVSMLWYGKEGLPKLALTNFQRANYLKTELEKIPGIKTFNSMIFNEFTVGFPIDINIVIDEFRKEGIEPGLNLEPYYSNLKNHLLIAVTEIKSKSQLDHYIHTVKKIIKL